MTRGGMGKNLEVYTAIRKEIRRLSEAETRRSILLMISRIFDEGAFGIGCVPEIQGMAAVCNDAYQKAEHEAAMTRMNVEDAIRDIVNRARDGAI
jgi:hypothetical protein